MVLKINEDFVLKCNFRGKGGKENQIINCFRNNLIKKNGVLFDCIDDDTRERYELKKQRSQQWFDPRKFFDISNEDRKITMVFVLCDIAWNCDMIATMSIVDFTRKAFSFKKLQDANNYAKKYPKDQIKSGIKVRELINNNKDIVEIIWKRKSV